MSFLKNGLPIDSLAFRRNCGQPEFKLKPCCCSEDIAGIFIVKTSQPAGVSVDQKTVDRQLEPGAARGDISPQRV